MHSVQEGMWDPQPPSKHASPLPQPQPPNHHRPHVITDTPAKRITFYKSGDSQFGGVRMAVHKRSFKCFDALLDDLSQKVPLPFGVRTVTTPRGTHTIKHLEQLQDGGCYLCSDRRQAKPINMELARKHPGIWYHDTRRPHRPETSSSAATGHLPHRQRRILLVKNSDPGIRRSVVLSRRSTRSMRAFLDEVSEVMQFHVRKLYTAEGRRVENVQSLMTCSGVLVCVGREAFSPMLANFIRKSPEERLPGLNSRSPGLGPRTPGNGARSPGTQGIRSPPHGAQSRASEYSEMHDSRKNVNFGLETKKSIIHPRSDSSNRSARFSLSSEKSYGINTKAPLMNEDIEKRVIVNKDGSLSVEMRVRFRLQSDETLQWSTQIKKSPSLTNECCPLSQSQPHYLQQGQSESCSDPDSTSFDQEGVHCPSQTHAPEGHGCPCCYQRPEQQYDFWENPAHSCKQPHVPPHHMHSHTHTMMRHTHSSSSSSSCNSRRVVRCRARLSNCSGTEQKQLVQEEMCVTEQVERRVEVEQDGETHVEVCRVSRCSSRSEVVAMDGSLRPRSGKSVEDEAMMEIDGERPLSAVSSSSRVLQMLKEDQDDVQPAGHEGGSRGVSAASSCVCGESTVEGIDQTPSSKSIMSRASCRSSKTKDDGTAEDEDEEIKRVVSSLSGHTAGSRQSRTSSVCPNCGGCKRESESVSPNPTTPQSNQENTNNGSENEESDVSTQSNKTNLTDRGRISAISNIPEDRASSAMSKTSNPEEAEKEEERASGAVSARSQRSERSHKSSCKNSTGATIDCDQGRSPSAKSAKSSRSQKSNCSCAAEQADIRTGDDVEGETAGGRALSALSAKSGASSKTSASAKLSLKAASPADDTAVEEEDTNTRALSALSVKSNVSASSGKVDRNDSALSAKSTKSNVSVKSGTSQKSKCSLCAKEEDAEERAGSAMSAKSNLTAKSNKSHKSKASERSPSPRSENERSASQISGKSVKSNRSVKSSKSCEPSGDANEMETEEKENEVVEEEEETEEKAGSTTSERAASAASSKSHKCERTAGDLQDGERVVSALSAKSASVKSHTSAKSSKSNHDAGSPNQNEGPSIQIDESEEQNETQERVASVASVKSKSSVRTSTSHKSNASKSRKSVSPSPNVVTIQTPGGAEEEEQEATERAASVASLKSNVSSASQYKSNKTGDIPVLETADEEKVANSSPKPPSESPGCPHSPVKQLLPGPTAVETRGSSALSVHSKTSTKSSRSKCRCGVKKEKDNEDLKSEAVSENTGSLLSSSTKRQRKESEGTEQPLSQNSGSVSLGLPEDQDTADSDSGKSSFGVRTGSKSRVRTTTPAKNTEESTNEEKEGTGSVKSRKSNVHGSQADEPPKTQALDIPTIETPNGVEDEAGAVEDLEIRSVKSASTAKASNRASNASAKGSKSSSARVKNSKGTGGPASKTEAEEDVADNMVASVKSKSSSCLRPESAASAHSRSEGKVSKESKGEGSTKSPKTKSAGSVKSKPQKTEAPIKSSSPCPLHSSKPCSKEEACSESILSHSLSAADLLKETMASARPQSRQSKASKTSDKTKSEKSAKCQKSKNQREKVETPDLTPACLPNASPNEVVSEWLRSIPADSSMLTVGDEMNEDEDLLEKMLDGKPSEEVSKEEEAAEDEKVDKKGDVDTKEEEEEKEEEADCDATEDKGSEQPPEEKVADPSPQNHVLLSRESVPKNWHSSAAVMKVLLSSSLGRCRSLPEVSPVYGRRLSTSARGLLDCLAQLQLIEPAVSPERQKNHCQQYQDIMTILQSLWLAEPENIREKDAGGDQITPPRSSSGVGMSSGSGGSGKENGNQGGDETNKAKAKETESTHEDEEVEKVVDEENEEKGPKETEAEPEETPTELLKIDGTEEPGEEEMTEPKTTENPSSSDKSSANGSSKSRTDNEQESPEDSSSGTPPTVLRAPLAKKLSVDPDPVWILHLLKKLEKQFMNHYITAMAEFKVRWDLDDSLILDTMIAELRDEVSRRIQNSIEREMKKIQSRAGRGGRSPRPPAGGNLSRESTMTEKRRRMLKVMKNQSVKTADSLSDGQNTPDFSDQRSEDEYCPCEACMRKKMAARSLKSNPVAAEAPVMMEFDLLKILQLKKSPSPTIPAVPQVEVVHEEEESNLEAAEQEEEEGDETKEDIVADVVLEETIPEEDEEEAEEEDGAEVTGDEEVETEKEENSEGEEAPEEETSGEDAREEETSGNVDEEEEEEAECQCESANNEEEEEATAEGEDEDTSNAGEDETVGDDEKTGDEEEEGETAGDEEETGTGEEEEESDKTTVKEVTVDEGEKTENGEGEEEMEHEEEEEEETTGRESGEEEPCEETEDSGEPEVENEEAKQEEEGNVSSSAEAEDEDDSTGEEESHEDDKGGESGEQEVGASEEERTSPQGQGVTEGEEADAEDSDTDAKRPSDTSMDESGHDEAGAREEDGEEGGDVVEDFKPEEEEEEESENKKEDGALLQQFTRTSVESQPGSLEDVDTDHPRNTIQAIEVPKMDAEVSSGGGSGNRRSRSPARVKRRKPKLSDVEMDDF